jgi:hypothetical protein
VSRQEGADAAASPQVGSEKSSERSSEKSSERILATVKTDPHISAETVAKMPEITQREVATGQGERLVQKELRRTLLKYKLRTDQELYDKSSGYIRQYY